MEMYTIFMSCAIFIAVNIHFCTSADPNKRDELYGPFKIGFFEIKTCDKPMKPQTMSKVDITSIKTKLGHTQIVLNLTILKEVGPLIGKLRILKLTDGKYVQTLNINQANVCQYYFPLKMLPFTLKVDKNCNVKQGAYINATMDLENIAHGFLGKKFFFGNFKFILEWFSKKFMVVCIEAIADIVKNV